LLKARLPLGEGGRGGSRDCLRQLKGGNQREGESLPALSR